MKKSKKGLIITLVVLFTAMIGCFVGGALCVAAGGIQAVKDFDLPKILGDFEAEDMGSFFSACGVDVDSIRYTEDFDISKSFDVSGFDTIVVEDAPHDIQISVGTGEANYKGKGPSDVAEDEYLKVEEDGTTLRIRIVNNDMDSFASGIVNFNTGDLKISVPVEFEGEFVISDCIGDINIDGVYAGKLTLKSTVGEVSGKNIDAAELTVKSVVGDIELGGHFTSFDIGDCVGDIEISTDAAIENASKIDNCMGNIDVTIGRDSKIDVKKDSNLAGIDIDIPETEGGVEIKIDNCMGEVNIDCD